YGCSNYPECKFTLAEHFRKKKLTKTNVKELLEGKETLVKGIKNKENNGTNRANRANGTNGTNRANRANRTK
ncbi:TPA: hypothetical protein ACGO7W_002238, partial [Streptococcus suis]